MVEDMEVGVKLVPDTSELEDVEGPTVSAGGGGAGGGGGGGSAAEGAAGGGFAGAELGSLLGPGALIIGLLAGVLSQVKIVAQFTGLIFRLLGRALLPAIVLLLAVLRPLINTLAGSVVGASRPQRTISAVDEQLSQDLGIQGSGVSPLGVAGGAGEVLSGITTANPTTIGSGIDQIASAINQQKNTADHRDEDKKNQDANVISSIIDEFT